MTNSLIPLLVIHHSFTLLRKLLTNLNENRIVNFDHLLGMSQLVIATPNQQIHLHQRAWENNTIFKTTSLLGNTFFACNSCLAWPCKKWCHWCGCHAGWYKFNRERPPDGRDHRFHLHTLSLCAEPDKYNRVSSASNIGFKNQIPTITYSRYKIYLSFQSHVSCDLNAVVNAVPLLMWIKI